MSISNITDLAGFGFASLKSMEISQYIKALMIALSFGGAINSHAVPVESDRFGDISICEQLLRNDGSQHLRNQFVQKYASKIYASESQNESWIREVYQTRSSPHFYVAMENAQLKNLNDKIIRDKDLVTALTNFHKELFLNNLNTYLPENSFALYSDFKSIRLRVFDVGGEAKYALLESLLKKTNKEFFNHPYLQKIVRGSDLKKGDWFTLGLGLTEGEAALAARGARLKPSHSLRFDNSQFQVEMATHLSAFKSLHQKLIEQLRDSDMIEHSSANGPSLSLDVFVHCRKSKDAPTLLNTLLEEYPSTQIGSQTAKRILNYCSLADEFSPSLLTAKREIIAVDQAPYGVMALDFIGLGAENLKATADALVQSRDVTEALEKGRLGEKVVTNSFLHRKRLVKTVIENYFNGQVSVRFSGDDGIIIPQKEFVLGDQLNILNQLSRLYENPFFRMSTIKSNEGQSDTSSQLISQAESIEKSLRPLLRKELGPDVSKKIHVNVFNTEKNGINKAFLLLQINTALSKSQVEVLYSIFRKSVKSVERELQEQGQDIVYEVGDIFSTREQRGNY